MLKETAVAAPSHVTGDQVRAVVSALNLDDVDFETIRSITIDTRAVTVNVLLRNADGRHYTEHGDIASEDIVMGVRWA